MDLNEELIQNLSLEAHNHNATVFTTLCVECRRDILRSDLEYMTCHFITINYVGPSRDKKQQHVL